MTGPSFAVRAVRALQFGRSLTGKPTVGDALIRYLTRPRCSAQPRRSSPERQCSSFALDLRRKTCIHTTSPPYLTMTEKNLSKLDTPPATTDVDTPSRRRLVERLARASDALSGMALGGLAASSLIIALLERDPGRTASPQAISQPLADKGLASKHAPIVRPVVRQAPTQSVTPSTPPKAPLVLPEHVTTAGAAQQQSSPTALAQASPAEPLAAPSPGEPAKANGSSDPTGWSELEISSALKECVRVLAPIVAEIEPQQPIRNGQCGMPAPVSVRAAGRDRVELQTPAVANCAVVAALAKWVDQTLQPAAREVLGSPVMRLINTSSYACRNRNNERIGPISEHAFGNAVDIGGFVLADGRIVRLLDGWGPVGRDAKPADKAVELIATPAHRNSQTLATTGHPANLGGPVDAAPAPASASPVSAAVASKFLHRIHDEACKLFGTVLGPEANDEHRNHLHFDLKARRSQHVCQ